MKRALILIITLALFLIPLTGCSLFKKSEYTIYYDLLSEPKNLDPQTASDKSAVTVIRSIFEGLFYVDETGNLQNGYATEYDVSEDGLVYTFKMRKEGKWENNESVTAHDFVFALKRLLLPETESNGAIQFFSIKNAQEINEGTASVNTLGVVAKDDYTLMITLEEQNDNLLYLLSTTFALPCNEKYFIETKGKYGLGHDKILANGPFDTTKWIEKSYINLKKNKLYYDSAQVLPSNVRFYFRTPEESLERLLGKKINAAFIKGEYISEFHNKGYNYEPIENTTVGIALNCNSSVFSNPEIRKAVASCFDRSTYSSMLPEYKIVANAFIPNGLSVFDQNFRKYAGNNIVSEFDKVKAYNMYQEAIETELDTKIVTVNLIVNKDTMGENIEYFSNTSQIFQKELSLFVNIEELTTAQYNSRINSGNYDMAIASISAVDYSINTMLSMFESNSDKNISFYNNPEYDALIADLYSKNKKSHILDIAKKAEQMLLDDVVFIPMFYSTDYFVESKKTTGIIYNQRSGQIDFKRAVVK